MFLILVLSTKVKFHLDNVYKVLVDLLNQLDLFGNLNEHHQQAIYSKNDDKLATNIYIRTDSTNSLSKHVLPLTHYDTDLMHFPGFQYLNPHHRLNLFFC
jgi:hypothetical protein